MRVRSLSLSVGAVALAAGGLAIAPAGVAQAVDCAANPGFYANNDAYQDVAVGAPREDTNGTKVRGAGSVTIVYGKAGGSFGGGSILLSEKDVGGTDQKGDNFGAALAVGDVNGDKCYDLVIGVPGKASSAGRIVVVLGSPTGLVKSSAKWISESTSGSPAKAEAGDQFGSSLAFSGPDFQYLWVGAPGENIGKVVGAGAVMRFSTSKTGSGNLPVPGSKQYYQGSAGGTGTGTPEKTDRFGEILSGSPHSLLVGVPKEYVGTKTDAGQVYAFDGTSWTAFTQDSTAPMTVPNAVGKSDRFGQALTQLPSCSGNPDQEAYVVATPGENLTGAPNAGAVSVLDLGTTKAVQLTQSNLAGTPEENDAFGRRVAVDGHLLAVASPTESGSGKSKVNIGVISQAMMGCDGSGTPIVTFASQMSLDSADVNGDALKGDRLGLELAFGWSDNASAGPRLLVGAPLKADGNVSDAGRVTVFTTKDVNGLFVGVGSTGFGQSNPGIGGTQERNDQFGAVLAGNGAAAT